MAQAQRDSIGYLINWFWALSRSTQAKTNGDRLGPSARGYVGRLSGSPILSCNRSGRKGYVISVKTNGLQVTDKQKELSLFCGDEDDVCKKLEVEEDVKAEPTITELKQLIKLLLSLVVGLAGLKTMKLRGTMCGQELVELIDLKATSS